MYCNQSGASQDFAQRIANDAPTQGYLPELATLGSYAGRPPTNCAVVIVTASYEGQPTENARQFVAWLAQATKLNGVKYAVFG